MDASDALGHTRQLPSVDCMKPSPLLDFWQKPDHAGEPVALFATTFALEPDFFEQNCLARFLEVSSVNEDTGSVDDIVASVELHELLQKTKVTVLADRTAPVQRTSLLWDLLGCKVDGALLHAKIAVLLWENATRVILGSMNLTSAGYRRQIELGLAADLGSNCLFPQKVLRGIGSELASYLELVPGYNANAPVFARASETLEMFGRRISDQRDAKTAVRVAFAPTNATKKPLDRLSEVWGGGQPLIATHLSPFWDTKDSTVLESVKKLLTGRPASNHKHRVAVVLGPRGQTSFPGLLAKNKKIDSVHELEPLDTEVRTLHAKCLLLESNDWVAALVGSSNHTLSGLGFATHPHREMNVWLGAHRDSKEGKALLDLIQLGKRIDPDTEEVEPKDEDEVDLPALPACFGLCRVSRTDNRSAWKLGLGIRKTTDMPSAWSISLTDETPVLTHQQWEAHGALENTPAAINQSSLPMCVIVRWGKYEVPWAVIADDRHGLPPGPALLSLRAQHLLKALATGRSLGDILREEQETADTRDSAKSGIKLDPLKRLEVHGSLLRRGRELAASLSAMQRRLERQVITLETLNARLTGPLGPEFVATKVAEAAEAQEQSRPEALFTVAEIALSVGRVNWQHVVEHVDRDIGFASVARTLERLADIRNRIGDEPTDMAAYADRAIKEARQCLSA
jgi:hypothetical protein